MQTVKTGPVWLRNVNRVLKAGCVQHGERLQRRHPDFVVATDKDCGKTESNSTGTSVEHVANV